MEAANQGLLGGRGVRTEIRIYELGFGCRTFFRGCITNPFPLVLNDPPLPSPAPALLNNPGPEKNKVRGITYCKN